MKRQWYAVWWVACDTMADPQVPAHFESGYYDLRHPLEDEAYEHATGKHPVRRVLVFWKELTPEEWAAWQNGGKRYEVTARAKR